MLDKIKRRIEQRISEGRRFSIERAATADTDVERDTSVISAHVASELERHMSEMYDDEDALEAAAQSHNSVRDFGGLRTQRQWEKHVVERLSVGIGSPMKALVTVLSGTRVFGPPYDLEWSEGAGLAFGGRIDGEAITVLKDGFSAAGIGFYLSANEPIAASITPQGTYDWNWFAFENLPFVRSRGGMGITIYTNLDPQPTISRQSVLWSVGRT